MKRFEYFDHTSDIGVRVYGKTLEELFKNSARSLFETLIDLKKVDVKSKKEVLLKATNTEELLIDFLGELLYYYSTKEFIIKDVVIKNLSSTEIVFEIKGEKFDKSKHAYKREVKAVTHHNFKIKKEKDFYVTEMVFDV